MIVALAKKGGVRVESGHDPHRRIGKIYGGNLLRVMWAVERAAC
jgi:hypothetical protein